MARPPTAVITGANRGIGLCIARAFAERGMRIALTARDAKRLDAAANELRAQGADVVTIAADLIDEQSSARIIDATVERFGPPDVLVNNAGSAPSLRVEETTDALMEEMFALHVTAPLRLIRAVLPSMRKRGSGCIVQIASTAGLRGFPFTSAYTAAKHAMVGLTRALHEELGDSGVHAYAVCPGFVDTDLTHQAAAKISARGKTSPEQAIERLGAMNAIGRMHKPEEVAEAVAWLCTERPRGCVYELDRAVPTFV